MDRTTRRTRIVAIVVLVALALPLVGAGVVSAVRSLRDDEPSGPEQTQVHVEAARYAAGRLAGPWDSDRAPTRDDVLAALGDRYAEVEVSENLPGHHHDGWFEVTAPGAEQAAVLGIDIEEQDDGSRVLAAWVDAAPL